MDKHTKYSTNKNSTLATTSVSHCSYPLTVLVVDDRPLILTAESGLLTQFGFYVVTATSAADALELLEHSPVDLVITDIEMPGMRGDELAYEIHKKYPDMPVIAATTGNLMELAINKKARFHKVFNKPLTKEKLSFFTLKQQKERCMIPTQIKVVEGPNGRRIYLGAAFPGLYFTVREAELALFLPDYKYHEIATMMSVSCRTTEYYATNMKKKLRCENKRHLIYILKNSGLLEQLKLVIDIDYLLNKPVAK